jgi:membrane protein involved in colicin uptake
MIWAAFFKGIPTFLHTWRIYIVTGMILTAAITVFNYVDNHGEMKAQLASGKQVIDGQIIDIEHLRIEIAKRDERLAKQREVKLAELEDARVRLEAAYELIDELRTEQERVQKQLEVTRFQTLEAIRDDEDFADWVDGTVPPVAWGLLRQAAEGRSND